MYSSGLHQHFLVTSDHSAPASCAVSRTVRTHPCTYVGQAPEYVRTVPHAQEFNVNFQNFNSVRARAEVSVPKAMSDPDGGADAHDAMLQRLDLEQ